MKKSNILSMTQIAIFIAIELVLNFTPLGYMNVPGLSITFLMVPVALAAILLGTKAGAILGLTFGLTSFAQCFGASVFGATLLALDPISTFIVCVVPRVLAGLLPGMLFALISKGKEAKQIKYHWYIITAFVASALNSVLFMTALIIGFWDTPYISELATGMNATNPLVFAVLFVGINGLIEAIVCCFIGGSIAKALHPVVNKSKAN